MRRILLPIGAALALTSAWALAQEAPESLLPPGFDRAAPKAGASHVPAPDATPPPGGAGGAATPLGQAVPGDSGSATAEHGPAAGLADPAIKLPPPDVLAQLSPDELAALLNVQPKTDIPPAARHSMKQIGILDDSEGGMPAGSLAGQNASLVRAVLAGNKGILVSRWGHILLRRALASRLDAPADMNPADFTALRAALLLRMGEGEAARALVQDVDTSNYSPDLTQAALDAYIFTADFTGICPAVTIQGGSRDDPQWQMAKSICTAFRGDGNLAMSQLDRDLWNGKMAKIDVLLAQKYAGAAGKARRAVKIEWDDVNGMTPWRYALTIGVGLQPPAALMRNAGPSYDYMAATAPMAGLPVRAAAADRAAAAGILSSAAMVDLYSQIYLDQDITGDWAGRASLLRDAYVADDAKGRLAAMRQLWDGAAGPLQRYSRQVLTAYAAARMPVDSDSAGDAPDLVASMLAAGLDRNALQWVGKVDSGSLAWGELALCAPVHSAPVDLASLEKFYSNDNSEAARKSRFLLAGLDGLDRLTPDAASQFARKLGLDMGRHTRWTGLIEKAADVNNAELVSLLAGAGMQGATGAR